MAFFPRQPFFMGKDEAFKNYFVGLFLKHMGVFPVARGHQDAKAIENALAVLREENVLGMFPEGKRIKENTRAHAKKGIGLFAITADAPLIPVALIADFTLFSQVKCKIGNPIYFSKEHFQELNNDVYYKISNDVLDSIYKLIEG
jgi:1-acyl-sn-glycerol-3-phosphate acyltransferase